MFFGCSGGTGGRCACWATRAARWALAAWLAAAGTAAASESCGCGCWTVKLNSRLTLSSFNASSIVANMS
jgi:hypothetical protein